jgi:hypothetical protein
MFSFPGGIMSLDSASLMHDHAPGSTCVDITPNTGALPQSLANVLTPIWGKSEVIHLVALAAITMVGAAALCLSAASIAGGALFVAVPLIVKIVASAMAAAITALGATALGLAGQSIARAADERESAIDAYEDLQNNHSQSMVLLAGRQRQLDDLQSRADNFMSDMENTRRGLQERIDMLTASNTVIRNRAEANDQRLAEQDRLIGQLRVELREMLGEIHDRNISSEDRARAEAAARALEELELADADSHSSYDISDDERSQDAMLFEDLSRSAIFSSHLSTSSVDDWNRSMLDLASSALPEEEISPQQQGQIAAWANYFYQRLPSMDQIGNTITAGAGLALNKAAVAGSALKEFIADNFVEYNHPWKQKKYQIATKEMLGSFLRSSLADMSLLMETEVGRTTSTLMTRIFNIAQAQNTDVDYRVVYYEIISAMRAVIETDEYQQIAAADASALTPAQAAVLQTMRALCHARYHDVHMYAFCEQLVRDVIAAGGGSERSIDPMVHRGDFEAIDAAPREWKGTEMGKNIGKLKGYTNINFDPALYCNVPYSLGDMPLRCGGEDRMVRLLRMGVPTIQKLDSWQEMFNEWSFIDTGIDPIWQEYIAQMGSDNKTHLYVSFQNDIPRLSIGDESSRNAALKKIADRHAHFKFVVLAQDSPFYLQQGPFGDAEMSRGRFYELFMAQLLGPSEETGFYFPSEWKADQEFAGVLNQMHVGLMDVLFADKGSLTRQERMDYIEIFEACLFLHLIVKTGASSANGTCKDAIDRAMKTLSIVLSISSIGQEDPANQELLRIQKTYAHAPAFMVKKQALIESRRDRMLSAMQLLMYNPEVQGRMQEWLGSNQEIFGLIPHQTFRVERKPGQDF